MTHSTLETDYLVVGSGAMGMAFTDTLLTETDADVIMVDRYDKAGGHWNVAYPFVTLHQPSLFYGVSSRELSSGRKDAVGLNKGMHELASGAEVSAYFDQVMRRRFLASGRVRFFPMCNYTGDGKFNSRVTGETFEVSVGRKTVDATFLKTSVPATHTPGFDVQQDVRFIPLNDLPKVDSPPAGYVVIGAGKTGIDACLWLLEHGVDPDDICWIVSRDAWLVDRQNTQPTEEFFSSCMGSIAKQMEAIVAADSIPDLFARLEEGGVLVRIDPTVQPSMFHAATVSQAELKELRRIRNVVRLGRVERLEREQIVLRDGTIPTTLNHLHVDCSARAISDHEAVPVFDGNVITPQTVRPFQPVFSASFIAHMEACGENLDERAKNELCTVVPLPNHDTDWVRMQAVSMFNQYRWSLQPELKEWLSTNRLDGFSHLIENIADDDQEKLAIMQRIQSNVKSAAFKLQQFAAELN